MSLIPLTSKQVLEFLPLNTWTEVHLQPSGFKNVYVVSTNDRMEKRKKDMESISLLSSFYKVTEYKCLEIVGVKIEGKWFRGKLRHFNEFRTDNTTIQLIDYGYILQTKLENLFVLPYLFMYEPLALPVIFKDFIPEKRTFSIKPLLSESNLFDGAVLVDVNYNDTELEHCVNEKQLLESKKDINSTNGPKILSVQNISNGNDSIKSSISVISKETINNVPLKNGDYCILTYFKDFACLYVGKAIKCGNNGSYNFVDDDNVLNTAMSTDKIPKHRPVVGDTVKVFSSQYDGLYRAKILKNNNGSYDVFYIDFGNIETVPSNVIYELADELKKPGIAVKIRLSDLRDIQTTEQIENMFQTFCDVGKPFVIEYDENSKNCLESVKLKDIENGSYIDSKYIMKCTSTQPGSNFISNNWQSGDRVEFLSGINVDNILVRNIKLYEEFKNVLYQLKRENSANYKPIAVKVHDIVAVYSTKFNGGIYRARVMVSDLDYGNMVKCHLIDFGQVDMIPPKNIFSLPNYVSLNKIPTMVCRVSLAGLNKILNSKIIQYLSSSIGKTYVMEYYTKAEKSTIHVAVLKELQSSLSLNDEIQKLFCNESSPRQTLSQK